MKPRTTSQMFVAEIIQDGNHTSVFRRRLDEHFPRYLAEF